MILVTWKKHAIEIFYSEVTSQWFHRKAVRIWGDRVISVKRDYDGDGTLAGNRNPTASRVGAAEGNYR